MNKIKVLHFELSDRIGGIESLLYNLYRKTDRERFQFDFVSLHENPAYCDELRKFGGNIYKTSSYKNINAYRSDVRKIICKGYDVVHLHKNSAANIIPLKEAKNAGIPTIIVHSHNTSVSRNNKLYKAAHLINKKSFYELASCHLACSEEAGRYMYGNKPFEIVKNGIDTAEFAFNEEIRKEMRERLNIDKSAFVVGHVGRFCYQKNHEKLIDIFYEISKRINNAVLILVGEGEEENKIKEKVKMLDLEKRVLFLEKRTDVNNLYQAMDVFVMPSFYEGLPVVGVEAQASGLPCVLSDKVPEGASLTDSCLFVSLDNSSAQWAEEIIDITRNFKRGDTTAFIKNAGYDIGMTAEFLENIYSGTVKVK